MLNDTNIKIENGKIYCNGYDIGLTSEEVQDYCIQTGQNGQTVIEYYYKHNRGLIRDQTLEQILNEKTSE